MKTTDPRDMTWQEIRDQLVGLRECVWQWLVVCGPATTSVIAEGSGLSILTVRPRVCELASLGFVECVGRQGREGIYRAVTIPQRQARHEEDLRESSTQLHLKFS